MAVTDGNTAVDGEMETAGGGGTFTRRRIYFSFFCLICDPESNHFASPSDSEQTEGSLKLRAAGSCKIIVLVCRFNILL